VNCPKNENILKANGMSSLKYFLKTGSLNALPSGKIPYSVFCMVPHSSNIYISFTLVSTQLFAPDHDFRLRKLQ
jgi:hypothetical protein